MTELQLTTRIKSIYTENGRLVLIRKGFEYLVLCIFRLKSKVKDSGDVPILQILFLCLLWRSVAKHESMSYEFSSKVKQMRALRHHRVSWSSFVFNQKFIRIHFARPAVWRRLTIFLRYIHTSSFILRTEYCIVSSPVPSTFPINTTNLIAFNHILTLKGHNQIFLFKFWN